MVVRISISLCVRNSRQKKHHSNYTYRHEKLLAVSVAKLEPSSFVHSNVEHLNL